MNNGTISISKSQFVESRRDNIRNHYCFDKVEIYLFRRSEKVHMELFTRQNKREQAIHIEP